MRALFVLLPLLALGGCGWMGGAEEEPPPPLVKPLPGPVNLRNAQAVREVLLEEHSAWKGVPYRLGGNDRRGLDCSAFTQRVYRERFGIAIPRETSSQRIAGRELPPARALPGDLLFFNTGPRDRHVGIYVGGQLFLHVSTQAGVMLSSLADSYWARRLVTAVRIGPG
ncbi:MAG: NlpC/P60 family protein [Gammaproteobacteria bacterium]